MQEFIKKITILTVPQKETEGIVFLCSSDTTELLQAFSHPIFYAVKRLQTKSIEAVHRLQGTFADEGVVENQLFHNLLDCLIEDQPTSDIYKGDQAKKNSVRRALFLGKFASSIYKRSFFKGDYEERLANELGFGADS